MTRRLHGQGDAGSAVVEFVGVAVVLLVPLVYLAVALLDVQRSVFAVTQGAREAGRAVVVADSLAGGTTRAQQAADLALADQGVGGPARVTYGAPGSCGAAAAPSLGLGSRFSVCVSRSWAPPGVPGVLAPQGLRVSGQFVVDVDLYREER